MTRLRISLTTNLKRLNQFIISLGTSWMLGSWMGAKGKQDLWTKKKPEVVVALRHVAIIQSTESSNRTWEIKRREIAPA